MVVLRALTSSPPLRLRLRFVAHLCHYRPCGRRGSDEAVLFADLRPDRRGDVGVVAQILLGVLAPLADALAVERVPGAALLDRAALRAEVDDLAVARDA